MFKKNALVTYRRRSGATGTGKITAVQETGRGLWYEVTDTTSKTTGKFRAAQLSLA